MCFLLVSRCLPSHECWSRPVPCKPPNYPGMKTMGPDQAVQCGPVFAEVFLIVSKCKTFVKWNNSFRLSSNRGIFDRLPRPLALRR